MEIGENRKIENVRIVVQISGLEGGGGIMRWEKGKGRGKRIKRRMKGECEVGERGDREKGGLARMSEREEGLREKGGGRP